MANTRLIKRRITAANNISKITKAMEMVAASKMKRAQEQAVAARPYSRALQASLKKVSQNIDPSLHPLLSKHAEGLELLIVISTDKGLCGSLNNQLMKATHEWQRQHPEGQVVAVGKKAIHFSQLLGVKVFAQFTELPEHISTKDVLPITTLAQQEFLTHGVRSVDVLYTDFINTLSQKARRVQLLPIGEIDDFVIPADEQRTIVNPKLSHEYTIEPDPASILSDLLPYYVENSVYQAFLEARASEHSARMVTMKNASENASDLVSELKLEFNKSRQAAITSELLDITIASLTIT
jgi:F-type H+-transporting ATPase subunit gamma